MFPNDLCGFRKLESTKVQNEEISKSLTSKEVSLQLTQKQLDEKTYECSVLARQLQSTLDDARRQVEMLANETLTVAPSHITGVSVLPCRWKTTCRKFWLKRERLSPKHWTCRASWAEPKLSRVSCRGAKRRSVTNYTSVINSFGSCNSLWFECCCLLMQMERRYQTQLQNMKDRLEQSDSKNRSLQNYVHFLKTSYGNVYADSLHTSWFKMCPFEHFYSRWQKPPLIFRSIDRILRFFFAIWILFTTV